MSIPLVFQVSRKEAFGCRKLVVLTHRTGRVVQETPHSVSIVLGYVAPLPCRLTHKTGCPWWGWGTARPALLNAHRHPNPISPIDFQARGKHSCSLVTASLG